MKIDAAWPSEAMWYDSGYCWTVKCPACKNMVTMGQGEMFTLARWSCPSCEAEFDVSISITLRQKTEG